MLSIISIGLILSLFQYLLYFIFVTLGAFYLYKLLTTEEERKVYRTKILKQINERKNAIVKKNQVSPFQNRLRATGYTSLNATRYHIVRWSFLIFITFYYIVIPLTTSNHFDKSYLAIPLILILLSEPSFSYSLTNKAIDFLINRKKRLKQVELFTLFDMLKAELSTLNANQEVNIYNILKESLPMYEHIAGTISRFLSLWKSSPQNAKDVFFNEIGGESSKVLGDILYKLDNTTKLEALKIIESESSVFSFSYYESELQGSIKRKNMFFILFSGNILLIISWLIVIVFTMFSDTLKLTN